MDEVCDRCVVLKGLPINCSEDTVNEVLELAHDDFRFKDRYEKLCTYKPTEDDVRWIVLFNTARDAQLCIESGKWLCNTEVGRHEVIPDLCSDCIIPDEWILNEDWVITNSPNENDGISTPLSSVDAADYFAAVAHGGASDSKSIRGEHASLDESTEVLQGAVGGSNYSTAFDHRNVDNDAVGSRKRDNYTRKLPPLPTKQTPCIPLNPVQDTYLIQYLFGSGQQDSISPSQCLRSKDFLESDQKQHNNGESRENNLLKETLENADEDTSYVQEPPQANNQYEPLQDDYKPSKSFSSCEMFGSGIKGEVSRFGEENMLQEECDEQSSKQSLLLSDEAVVKSTYTKQAEKHDPRSTSSLQVSTTNAIGIKEPHCQNNDDSGDRNQNLEQNDANENLKQNDANKNSERTDSNENTEENNEIGEHTDTNKHMQQNHTNLEQNDTSQTLDENRADDKLNR